METPRRPIRDRKEPVGLRYLISSIRRRQDKSLQKPMERSVLSDEVVSALVAQDLLKSTDTHQYFLCVSVFSPYDGRITFIPHYAHSAQGFEYLGFDKKTAQILWRVYGSRRNPDFLGLALEHVSNPAFQDMRFLHQDWTRLMSALGICEKVQRQLLQHGYDYARAALGCKYWLREHVRTAYERLTGLDAQLREWLGLQEGNVYQQGDVDTDADTDADNEGETEVEDTGCPQTQTVRNSGGSNTPLNKNKEAQQNPVAQHPQVERATDYTTETAAQSHTATPDYSFGSPSTLGPDFDHSDNWPRPLNAAVWQKTRPWDVSYRERGRAITRFFRTGKFNAKEDILHGGTFHVLIFEDPRLPGVNLPATQRYPSGDPFTFPWIMSPLKIRLAEI